MVNKMCCVHSKSIISKGGKANNMVLVIVSFGISNANLQPCFHFHNKMD